MTVPLLKLLRVDVAASVGVDNILRDLSFSVAEGEKIAIVGVSGSGKSSLLRLLNYLIAPVSGEIYFFKKPYRDCDVVTLRQQITLVAQEPKLLGMKVKDALIYPLQLQHLSKQTISDRLTRWCEALQIPQVWLDRTELQLSLGQRQLVTIARALMLEPRVLLLDEPTSALDTGASDRLLSILDRLNQENRTTIFMVNHQLNLAREFGDRILYLNSGKLERDVISSPEHWQQIGQLISRANQDRERDWGLQFDD